VQDLDTDQIMSLDEDMTSLNGNLALLGVAEDGGNVLRSAEIQKALQEAQKALQDLKLGSDPI
jgi:hypothetical protein